MTTSVGDIMGGDVGESSVPDALPLHGRRVLVTGGSGFIGTHALRALATSGATVLNLDLRPAQDPRQAGWWRRCDLLQAGDVVDAMSRFRPDAVLNLAANTNIAEGRAALRVNTQGLHNLLVGAEVAHLTPYLIHVSTQLVMAPGHEPSSDVDFAPYSDYGASKAESELLLHQDSILEGAWTIVRPTNVWGPLHPTFADQIWKFIDRGWYMHPTGPDPRRSYGYVENVVHQVRSLIQMAGPSTAGRTLYVGDEPMPSLQWLDAFSLALRGRPVRRVPRALLTVAAQVGEVSGRWGGPRPVDRGRLFRMTTDYAVPMQPTIDLVGLGPVRFEEGVTRTVRWLRS